MTVKDEKQCPASVPYQSILLARLGEIALKGLNRRRFEQRLMKNIARRLRPLGAYSVNQSQSRIWVVPEDQAAAQHLEEALHVLTDIFGLVSASKVWRFPSDLTSLLNLAECYVREEVAPATADSEKTVSFKVETRRGNKAFPLQSGEISAEVGAHVLERFPHLQVDVHRPDFTLYVEVRNEMYLYSAIVPGLRGLPVGMSGRGLLMLSGGIDSPVAGFMAASRGVELEAIYFHTFPYTSDRAKEKVVDLARILTKYTGRINLHIVDFTEAQLTINQNCPADMLTIVMRRIMIRVADRLAVTRHCGAIITGESLGQVASQTMEALACTNRVSNLPVFRPLIGIDKDDTVSLARRIGTFETSILPYEDCCTVFVAKHPKTRPTLDQAEAAEKHLQVDDLVSACLKKVETRLIKFTDAGDDDF